MPMITSTDTALLIPANAQAKTPRPLKLRKDRLYLEVGVEVGVALLTPNPRCLVAAEGRRRVAREPGVDVDVAGVEHRREPVGVGDVARPDARREAVLGVVRPRRDLFELLEGHRDEHRAEDLLARYPHSVL